MLDPLLESLEGTSHSPLECLTARVSRRYLPQPARVFKVPPTPRPDCSIFVKPITIGGTVAGPRRDQSKRGNSHDSRLQAGPVPPSAGPLYL